MVSAEGIESARKRNFNNLQRSRWQEIHSFRRKALRTARKRHGRQEQLWLLAAGSELVFFLVSVLGSWIVLTFVRQIWYWCVWPRDSDIAFCGATIQRRTLGVRFPKCCPDPPCSAISSV